jgi:hypothetical protein
MSRLVKILPFRLIFPFTVHFESFEKRKKEKRQKEEKENDPVCSAISRINIIKHHKLSCTTIKKKGPLLSSKAMYLIVVTVIPSNLLA